jgi:GNAT superfamily N-acetyltransferase
VDNAINPGLRRVAPQFLVDGLAASLKPREIDWRRAVPLGRVPTEDPRYYLWRTDDYRVVRRLITSLRDALDDLGRRVLEPLEYNVYRGATCWVLDTVEGADTHHTLSVSAWSFGQRKRCGWGRYANWYTAYTPPPIRRQGHARRLYKLVAEQAVGAGCDRLKALAGSWLGVQLHLALGHEIWGLTKGGELQVDTPLVARDDWPDSVPRHARGAVGPGRPMVVGEVREALTMVEKLRKPEGV